MMLQDDSANIIRYYEYKYYKVHMIAHHMKYINVHLVIIKLYCS